jgi:membrane protein
LDDGVTRPPKFTLKIAGALLVETGTSWLAHKAPRMGAALSYYTAFSLAPLLVLVFSIASLIWTQHGEAAAKITDQFQNLIGPQAGNAVQEILEHAATARTASWGTAISIVILLFSASSAFGELQDSLNEIWEVRAPKQAFFAMIKERALSFSMVLILGFFVLVSLFMSALIAAVSKALTSHFPGLLDLANNTLSLFIFTGLFATIFRLLPDVPLTWRDVGPGALFSTILFMIGKILLAWYIGRSSTFSTYGAAGSFAIILLWVYYSAQILYLGAEFTRAYTKRYGSHRDEIAQATHAS